MINKNWYIKNDEIKELFTWDEAMGCIATDRILVDGAKVGYMYRELPDPNKNNPDSSWDSGWRFTAGDESDEFMDDSAKSGIYSLNTIANYDKDIVPLLNSPYNTAYFRDKNGLFTKEDFKPRED